MALKRSTQAFSKETDLLENIRNYFDTQTAAGKEVSRAELLEKFFPDTVKQYGKFSGTTAKTPALKLALGDDYNKLIYKGSQFGASKDIKKIVNQVLKNERPLTDVANTNLQQLTGASKRVVSKTLNEIPSYRTKIFPKLRKAVQRDNEEFFQVKLKDFDKLEKKFPRTISRPGSKQDFILQSLVRHDAQGGNEYKVISGNNFANYKIKDVATGKTITRDSIKESLKQNDPKFREASQVYDEVQEIKKRDFIDPVTKQNIGLGKALQKATGVDGPLHIHHVKGVAIDPLNNLQVATYKANLGGQIAKSTEDFKVLGIRGLQEGGKNITGAPGFDIEQNVERFSKFANRKILSDTASGFEKLKTPTKSLLEKAGKIPKVGKIATGVGAGLGLSTAASAEEAPEFGDPDTWDLKVPTFIQEYPLLSTAVGGTAAVGATLASPTGRKAVGEIFKTGIPIRFGPTGVAYDLATADYSDPQNRALLAGEVAIAPLAVEGTSKAAAKLSKVFGANPVVRRGFERFINLGMRAPTALKVARAASPLGIVGLAGEGIYQMYDKGYFDQDRLDPTAIRQSMEEQGLEIGEGLTEGEDAFGGRVGFDEGGPTDPSKRKFMKRGAGILGFVTGVLSGAIKVAPDVKREIQKLAPAFEKELSQVPAIIEELFTTIRTFGKQTEYPKPGSDTIKYEMGPYKMEEGPEGFSINKKTGDTNETFEASFDPETGLADYREQVLTPDLKPLEIFPDKDIYQQIGEDISKVSKDSRGIDAAEATIDDMRRDGMNYIQDGEIIRND